MSYITFRSPKPNNLNNLIVIDPNRRICVKRTMTTGKAISGFLVLAATLAISAVIAIRGDDASDAARLIEALALQPGGAVAEIGAGGGEITILFSRHVGPSGRVFSTELGADRLAKLRAAVENAEAANVTVLDGDANRTNLPEGCCDAVFMRSVYHHIEDPAAMNRSLRDSLRPGGRLAVMDFTPPARAEASSPAGRDEDGHHGVTPETVLKELVEAGFERVDVEKRERRGFLVVVRKPAEPSGLTHSR